jgi:hypothetical protein
MPSECQGAAFDCIVPVACANPVCFGLRCDCRAKVSGSRPQFDIIMEVKLEVCFLPVSTYF